MDVTMNTRFSGAEFEILKKNLAKKAIFLEQIEKDNRLKTPVNQDMILLEEELAAAVNWQQWTGLKIILTDSSSVNKRIEFLKNGAFSLWPKTITSEEIYYRLLNSKHLIKEDDKKMIVLHHNIKISLDQLHKQVFIDGKEIQFTPSEYLIFSQLATYHQRVYSREDLIQLVRGAGYATTLRTIDTHIKNIRKKTEEDPENPKIVQTVHGHGYRIN